MSGAAVTLPPAVAQFLLADPRALSILTAFIDCSEEHRDLLVKLATLLSARPAAEQKVSP